MQFSKLSFTQVLVAGLMVTSAAGAPLPLSGDLSVRDDFSGLEARDPSKIGNFFKGVGRKLKPVAEAVIQTALPGVEIAKREPEPSKIGRFFKKVGGAIKNEAQVFKNSVQMAAGAVGLTSRDVLETRDFIEARDVVEARDPSKIGNFFKGVGRKLKPVAEAVIQTALPGVEIAKREPEPSKIGRFFKKVGGAIKNEAQVFKNSVQMAAGAVGLTSRDVLETRDFLEARDVVDTLEARDFDEHWE